MAELTHVGGGVWLTPAGVELREGHHGGQRLHQHPNDPEDFLTIDELAELFVALNENEFELEQVDREVLSALWQIGSVDDILDSSMQELYFDGNRTFTFGDLKFFKLWYDKLNDTAKADVKIVVQNGQLRKKLFWIFDKFINRKTVILNVLIIFPLVSSSYRNAA